jgi:hypothetical protein
LSSSLSPISPVGDQQNDDEQYEGERVTVAGEVREKATAMI